MNATAGAALARGRQRAESLMADTCTITAPPVRTGVDGDGADVTTPGASRYSGKCRLQEQQVPGASPAPGTVGERPAWQAQQVVLSVPAAVTGVQVGDEVLMTASELDPRVVGRRLRVVAVTAKTYLTARRLECHDVAVLPFAGDEITVVTPGQATDQYSNVLPDWDAATRVTVLGVVEPLPGDETTPGGGQRSQVQDRYRVWLPAGTALTAACRLEWLGLVLDVDGDPKVWSDAVTPLPLEVDAYRVRG